MAIPVALVAIFLLFQSVDSACPVGFASYNSSCYFFSSAAVTLNWFKAEQACEALNSRLVSLESAGERNYVVSNVKGVSKDNAWI